MTSAFAGVAGKTSNSAAYTVGAACPHNAADGTVLTAIDVWGDGCLATDAYLYTPWTVVFDSVGNAYIADTNAASYAYVRKVDATSGVITLFAGGLTAAAGSGLTPCDGYTANGFTGSDPAVNTLLYANKTSGDGCPAVNPTTYAPYSYFKGIRDLAIDANYLYIADSSNSKVRKVSLSSSPIDAYHYYAHEVEPVAGFSGSGYTADGSLNTVQIKNVYAVAVDSFGNVFFGDQSGNAIRRATPTTYSLVGGVITPSVGSVVTVLGCPGGAPCSAVPSGTTSTCNLTGTASASKAMTTYNIYGLVFDTNGNLYASEKGCYSVRKIANNGSSSIDGTTAVTTLMGTGATGSYTGGTWMKAFTGGAQSSTRGLAPGLNGTLFVVNTNSVWQFDPSNTANSATNGWLRQFWNTGAGTTGCTGNVGTSSYWGCPAGNSTFNGSSQGSKGSVDQYGNLVIADGNDAMILKAAIGTDFAGVGPRVAAAAPLTDSIMVHGAGLTTSNISAGTPFAVSGTPTCTTNSTGDLATDCVVSATYTPTAHGVQTGTLTANGTAVALNAYGNPANIVSNISCDAATKVYGQADPTFTYTTSPAVSSFTVAPICGAPAQAGVGTSPITVTNLGSVVAAGYSFTNSSPYNQLTVTAATVSASITADNKVYDGTTTEPTTSIHCTLTGVVSPDVAYCQASSASFSQAGVGKGLTVTATLTLGGANAGNYVLASSNGTATADITDVPPAVSAKAIPYHVTRWAGLPGAGNNTAYTVGQACPSKPALTAVNAFGDGCPASDLILQTAYAVVFDASGNAYISDNNAASFAIIHKVDAQTGIATLFAGGLTTADLTTGVSPCVAYTDGGHTGADPAVTTLPATGGGAAIQNVTNGDGCPSFNPVTGTSFTYFKGIRDLAVDANYLYIADSSNSKIRKIAIGSSARPNLYYAHEVEPVVGAGGSGWSTDGVANAVQVKNIYAVAVDSFGNVFFADQSGNAIRRVGPVTYSVSGGVVTGTLPSVLTVMNCATSGSTCSTVPTSGCITAASSGASRNLKNYGIVAMNFDTNGNLFASSKGCYSVYKVAALPSNVASIDGSTNVSILMGTGATGTYTGGSWMQAYSNQPQNSTRGLTAGQNGTMFVINSTSVWMFDPSDVGGNSAAGWLHQIWGSDSSNAATCGSVYPAAPTAATSAWDCNAPESIINAGPTNGHGSIDAAGNLYVADGGDGMVLKASTGLDFIGLGPKAGTPIGNTASQLALIHGANISDSVMSITAPFTMAAFNTYSAGTADCSTYTSAVNPTDNATDCTYTVSFTPTSAGVITGTLTANGTALAVQGEGVKLNPTVTITCTGGVYNASAYSCTASAVAANGTTPVAGSFSFAPGAETNVGTYAETVTFTSSDPAYNDGAASGSLVITPFPATITAGNVNYVYGTTPGTPTCSVTPTVNPDNLTCTATIVGSATVPTASDANYTITAVDGTVTMTQATLTATAGAANYVWGSGPTTPGCVVTGAVAPDAFTCTAAVDTVNNVTVVTGISPTPVAADYTVVNVNGTYTIPTKPVLYCNQLPSTVVYGVPDLAVTCYSSDNEKITVKVAGPVKLLTPVQAVGSGTYTATLHVTGITTTTQISLIASQPGVKVKIGTPPVSTLINNVTLPAQLITVTPKPMTIHLIPQTWTFSQKAPAALGYFDPTELSSQLAYADKPMKLVFTLNNNATPPTPLKATDDLGVYALSATTVAPNYNVTIVPTTLTYQALGTAITQKPVAPATLTFKDTLAGTTQAKTQVIVLTNKTGAEQLTFTPTIAGPDFTIANTTKNYVPVAGDAANACTAIRAQACTFTVTFAPQSANTGALSEILTFAVADKKTEPGSGTMIGPFTYTLNGDSLGGFAVSTPTFAATSNGQKNTQTVTVTNNTAFPLTVGGIAVGGTNKKYFTVAPKTDTVNNTCQTGTPVAVGGTCTFTVTFAPIPNGTTTGSDAYSATITVLAKSQGLTLDAVPTQTINLAANSVQFVTDPATTPITTFTTKAPKATVSFVNQSNVAVTVPATTSTHFTTTALTLAPGKSGVVTIAFVTAKTDANGTYTGTVTLTDSFNNTPVAIAVSGTKP